MLSRLCRHLLFPTIQRQPHHGTPKVGTLYRRFPSSASQRFRQCVFKASRRS